MYFCPEVHRIKMFPRETFWYDPGDNTRILQDEGLGLCKLSKQALIPRLSRDFVAAGLSGLVLWPDRGDMPRGGMEPLTIVVSFLAV
jgi:hypothetical protein